MLHEIELIARSVLLSSARPDAKTEVWAYQTLAARNPGYRGHLAQALIRRERTGLDLPVRLRLSEEAVATARLIDPVLDHHATDILIWALDALQHNLFEAGRTADAWAARREILDLHHPGLHRRCYVTDCYAGKLPIPVEDWAAAAPNPPAAM
ncbi:hypothetical protein ACFQY4_11480 [Catellatospora bangladeshensis]|uniref:hypothetical protein n=1 Tax=Catellatospora bangladeshensis TaxID=310355 RepID=UPI001942E31F|nr:hypothetical protein [Catellatospora bangladeshensis]